MTDSNASTSAQPTTPARPEEPGLWFRWLLVAALLVSYLGLSLASVGEKSITFDEPGHITAGYSYWHRNDYRLMPENGNLPARWVSLPLVFVRCQFSPPDSPEWVAGDHIRIYESFFSAPGTDFFGVVWSARVMASLVGVALGLVIFLWTRSLMGYWAGVLALVLFVFSPAILGYGPLATSDMMVTLFFTLAIWMVWRSLHGFTWPRLFIAGLSVGGLMLSKMSAVVFLPMVVLVALICWLGGRPLTSAMFGASRAESRTGRAIHIAGSLAVIAAITWVLLWAAYGFRYSATRPDPTAPPGRFSQRWDEVASNKGAVMAVVGTARELHALPEAFLFGIASVTQAMTRTAFMNGQTSFHGFRLFFPYTVLVKTPIPLFILMGIGAWVLARSARHPAVGAEGSSGWSAIYDWIPLLIVWLVYWMFALTSNLNIGLRHVLPTYPAMCILGGAAALHFTQRSRLRLLVAVLAGVLVAESLLMYPNYLAYFNSIAGGPSQGYRHLVDSSLDWGQDLPGLKKWLDQHRSGPNGDEPVYFSFFGSTSIERYGIDAKLLPSFHPQRSLDIPPGPLGPGVYCISATMLQSACDFNGNKSHEPWTTVHEATYQALRADFERINAQADVGATIRGLIARDGLNAWIKRSSLFEALRLSRLCLRLRQREPDDMVGYSILIYRLTADDLEAALVGPPAELEEPEPPTPR